MEKLRPFLVLIGLGVAYAVLFMLKPDLDLQLQRHLYDGGFYLKDKAWVVFFYEIIHWLSRAIVVGTLGVLLWQGITKRSLNRHAMFLILCLAIGPGLVVNAIFKEHWGRARPAQITEFGGTKTYSPPLLITDQCEKNCSFVSGHASIGFCLAAFALLLTGWKRNAVYIFAVAFGLWVGFIRMAMGGHFFSDVIFSGIFTLLVIHPLYYLLYQWKKP